MTWTSSFLQVWYLGPNIGHAILGLKPAGCTYLAGECRHPHQHGRGISLLSPWVPLITIAPMPSQWEKANTMHVFAQGVHGTSPFAIVMSES